MDTQAFIRTIQEHIDEGNETGFTYQKQQNPSAMNVL